MKKLILASILLAIMATPVMANVTINMGGSEDNLKEVLDSVTVGGVSSVDVQQDQMSDESDSYWSITGTGISSATLIIELAGYAGTNTFGVYNGGQYVELFDGAAAAGGKVSMTIDWDGTVLVAPLVDGAVTVRHQVDFSSGTFGYYLDSRDAESNVDGRFHSDSSLNGGYDYMVAYQGQNTDFLTVGTPDPSGSLWTNNEYILAWEDVLQPPADDDYNDFVVIVESVRPVPAPGALLLGSLGVGFVGWLRRRKSL